MASSVFAVHCQRGTTEHWGVFYRYGKQNTQTSKENYICSEGSTFLSSSWTAFQQGPVPRAKSYLLFKGLFPKRILHYSDLSSGDRSRNEESPLVPCSFVLTVHDAIWSVNEPPFNCLIEWYLLLNLWVLILSPHLWSLEYGFFFW